MLWQWQVALPAFQIQTLFPPTQSWYLFTFILISVDSNGSNLALALRQCIWSRQNRAFVRDKRRLVIKSIGLQSSCHGTAIVRGVIFSAADQRRPQGWPQTTWLHYIISYTHFFSVCKLVHAVDRSTWTACATCAGLCADDEWITHI